MLALREPWQPPEANVTTEHARIKAIGKQRDDVGETKAVIPVLASHNTAMRIWTTALSKLFQGFAGRLPLCNYY